MSAYPLLNQDLKPKAEIRIYNPQVIRNFAFETTRKTGSDLITFALDSALEAVSAVFLLGALLYAYRLSKLTKGAEIVALAKPKSFFGSIFVAFASLLLMELMLLVNALFFSVPYLEEVARLLIIVTAFFGVFGLYSAVYYYRTSPKKVAASLERKESD
jgi:hypothetical protein